MNENTFDSVSASDAQTVSSSDAQTVIEVSFPDDMTMSVTEQLNGIQLVVSALLFFQVFQWVETRIKNAVKKVIDRE